jgi:hypothetical protein
MPDALKIGLQGVGQVGEGSGSNMVTDDKEQQGLLLSIKYKDNKSLAGCTEMMRILPRERVK